MDRQPGETMPHRRRLLLLSALSLLIGCAVRAPAALQSPPESVTITSGGPSRSASHLARVDDGVIVIDLGWWGAESALVEGLGQLGASIDDVIAVFLTHSHRDHIAGWRSVRHARFHLAEAELELLFGRVRHGGWIPRWASRLRASDLPSPGDIDVRAFSADTTFVFGADSVHAFLVPGHTAGSTAYLFRGTLFAGDAITWSRLGGFAPARAGYSDDPELARHSLASLRERIAPHRVELVCSAHLRCSAATDELWSQLLSDPGP
jgi:hydroxyacylglutathione hydrolase